MAFPVTIPIFAGFTFLGLTYGIYMNVSGFSFWYPIPAMAAILSVLLLLKAPMEKGGTAA